jgi:hypothetical protein
MILVFVLLNGAFVMGSRMLEDWNADQSVLILGNLILFIVSLVSFLITRRSLSNPNPNAFVRAMYGSFIIKFFVCAGVAFAYIMATGKEVNKPALFICMGLYVLYTVLEVAALTKILKRKNA